MAFGRHCLPWASCLNVWMLYVLLIAAIGTVCNADDVPTTPNKSPSHNSATDAEGSLIARQLPGLGGLPLFGGGGFPAMPNEWMKAIQQHRCKKSFHECQAWVITNDAEAHQALINKNESDFQMNLLRHRLEDLQNQGACDHHHEEEDDDDEIEEPTTADDQLEESAVELQGRRDSTTLPSIGKGLTAISRIHGRSVLEGKPKGPSMCDNFEKCFLEAGRLQSDYLRAVIDTEQRKQTSDRLFRAIQRCRHEPHRQRSKREFHPRRGPKLEELKQLLGACRETKEALRQEASARYVKWTELQTDVVDSSDNGKRELLHGDERSNVVERPETLRVPLQSSARSVPRTDDLAGNTTKVRKTKLFLSKKDIDDDISKAKDDLDRCKLDAKRILGDSSRDSDKYFREQSRQLDAAPDKRDLMRNISSSPSADRYLNQRRGSSTQRYNWYHFLDLFSSVHQDLQVTRNNRDVFGTRLIECEAQLQKQRAKHVTTVFNPMATTLKSVVSTETKTSTITTHVVSTQVVVPSILTASGSSSGDTFDVVGPATAIATVTTTSTATVTATMTITEADTETATVTVVQSCQSAPSTGVASKNLPTSQVMSAVAATNVQAASQVVTITSTQPAQPVRTTFVVVNGGLPAGQGRVATNEQVAPQVVTVTETQPAPPAQSTISTANNIPTGQAMSVDVATKEQATPRVITVTVSDSVKPTPSTAVVSNDIPDSQDMPQPVTIYRRPIPQFVTVTVPLPDLPTPATVVVSNSPPIGRSTEENLATYGESSSSAVPKN